MFDIVVITAANAAQANGYREQVNWRRKRGMLPESLEVLVVSDPGGRRVGSLGATVNVLKKLKDANGKRVFICHSGGDARRTPGYAAMGKAFTPMPMDGGIAMFDLILATRTPPFFGILNLPMFARMRSNIAMPPSIGIGVNALPIAA